MLKCKRCFSALVLVLLLCFTSCATPAPDVMDVQVYTVDTVPNFNGEPYVVINGNKPTFSADELVTSAYESYAPLDILGRCGEATACIGLEIMPTEERGSIGSIKPSGWQTAKYDIVDGKYLYNRCHLIGYQLAGENANACNLITGTRYLNVDGMLPFENLVADYVKETGNHVLYQVTPVFDGVNLVARGVQIQAQSVEDDGEGISFNIYAYNAQPGVCINYLNGESSLAKNTEGTSATTALVQEFVLNTGSKKIHLLSCSAVKTMSEKNKLLSYESEEALQMQGYAPCSNCMS